MEGAIITLAVEAMAIICSRLVAVKRSELEGVAGGPARAARLGSRPSWPGHPPSSGSVPTTQPAASRPDPCRPARAAASGMGAADERTRLWPAAATRLGSGGLLV